MSTRSYKKGVLTGSIALVAGFASPSLAQTGPTVDEVVITAQRFEETLRDVPISVAALDAERLEDLGVDDLKDITGQVPNLFINNFNGRSDTVRLFIRGIGQNDVSLTQDPSVALYIDNVYVGSAIGSSFDSLDLERVEILRGPQGTLYGRNATGGAVNLISRPPAIGEFGARASVTTGNYNLLATGLGVNIPLGEFFAAKLDYGRTLRDGWVENLGPGGDFSEQDRENARFALRFEPTSNFTADYAYDWSLVRDTQPFTTLTSFIAPTRLDGLYDVPGVPPAFAAFVGAAITYNDPLPYSSERPDTATSVRPVLDGDSEISGHALNMNWDLSPNFALRSITGYRKIQSLFQGDYLPTAVGELFVLGSSTGSGSIGGQNITTDFENFSQEFQALGTTNFGGGDLRYVTGLYYYTQSGSQAQESVFIFPRGEASAVIDDNSWAVFGEATFTPNAFNERLHMTFGARYSEDERTATRINESSLEYARLDGFTAENCANQAFIGQLPVPCVGDGAIAAATYANEFSNSSFSGSLTWELTPSINLYGRVAQGYKTGGTSERSADPGLFSAGYQPEEILSYEIGAKGLYFNNRLSVNVALFQMSLDQFQTSVQTGNTPGDRDFVGLDNNEYQGLEADATFAVTENLSLNAGLGLLDTEVGQSSVTFPLSGGGTRTDDLIGVFPYAPEQTITFGVNYARPLGGNFTMSAALNYAYQSESETSLNVRENTQLDSRGVLDGNLTLHRAVEIGDLSVRLWGRNILDEDYRIVDNRAFSFVGALSQAEWGEPQTFGVTISVEH